MNLDTVITKQQGIEAMQYLIANAIDDNFMNYAANYLYSNYKLGFLGASPIPEGISTMLDIYIEQNQYIKAEPAFLLTDTERQLITQQFIKALVPETTYTVKPEEHQFKVGDYVRYIHSTSDKALQINNINGDRYYFKQTEMSCLLHELELWQPKPNEWCWFWDQSNPKYSNLAQFKEMFNSYFKTKDSVYSNCAPFINELPTHLKD